MENTIENKQRFFAQYFGQEVGRKGELKGICHPDLCNEKYFLLLKPLSAITDEDAIEVGRIYHETNIGSWQLGKGVLSLWQGGTLNVSFDKATAICDYLRSKGYALPFKGVSVEEQVKNGWVELI